MNTYTIETCTWELIKRDLLQILTDNFDAPLKVRFSNRKGKLYVTVRNENIDWNNATPFRDKIRRLITSHCPDAHMTSGGMDTYTYRLNKDIPKPPKRKKLPKLDLSTVWKATITSICFDNYRVPFYFRSVEEPTREEILDIIKKSERTSNLTNWEDRLELDDISNIRPFEVDFTIL